MFILDRIGNVLALLGCIVGLWRWRELQTSRHLLTAFLGVSALCGFGQAVLSVEGFSTAWFGNLWDLSILLLLIPACMMVMRRGYRNPLKPLHLLAVGAWVFYYLAIGGIPNFDDYLSMTFYAFLALVGAALLSQYLDDSIELRKKPGFILGITALGVGMLDALTSFAMAHYDAIGIGFLTGLMTLRNAVWCGAYLLFAYSLLLKGRSRGKLRANASDHADRSSEDSGFDRPVKYQPGFMGHQH